MSQGQYAENVYILLKNSGTENAKDVRVRVNDAIVFQQLHVHYTTLNTINILNYWGLPSQSLWNFSTGNRLFPAGTQYAIKFSTVKIKESAPVTIHDIETLFTYTVY